MLDNRKNWKMILIFILCFSDCLFVCPFVSNKRQNGWSDRAQILYGTSHDPMEGLRMIKTTKKLCQKLHYYHILWKLTIFVSTEMRFSFKTRPGFSSLVNSYNPELIPFTLTQPWNPSFKLVNSSTAVIIVSNQSIKPTWRNWIKNII